MKTIIITLAILLATPTLAYNQMTTQESLRNQARGKTTAAISTMSPQNLSVIRFRKSVPLNVARYYRLGESGFTARMLIGLAAALRNNIKKNGRNYDQYFKADSFQD